MRFNSCCLYLSWEIHSKSFMLVTFSSISFAATSLAWTSITIRADNTARCILDNFPRTRATKLPSWVRKRKYSEAIHTPKTQAVLTQCNQTYDILSPDHRMCPGNFCLFSSEIQMTAQKVNTAQGRLRADFCLHHHRVQVKRKRAAMRPRAEDTISPRY